MVDISTAPYFDDYDPKKNYHKILFQPRRAVQVRELIQIQTYLQEQIGRFGDHVFKEGSMAIPGEVNYDLAYEYVTVNDIDFTEIVEVLETNEVHLTGRTSGVKAKVVQSTGNTANDPITFFLQYESGGDDIVRFSDNEIVDIETTLGVNVGNAQVIDTGQGSVLTVEPGIFYIAGNFVRTDGHRIILEKYSSTPSKVVGFRLHERIVSWSQDPSLLDNSAGTTNFNGIGADRLQMTLEPEVFDIDEEYDRENFIELAKFSQGVLQRQVRGPEYNVLEDVLARRTYDQSGDYTVSPFGIRVREHLDDGSNGGLYPAPEGDESKFLVGIESGKAYVRGYEIENFSTKYLPVDKAREVAEINNSSFSLPLGNLIVIDDMNRLPPTDAHQQVTFYSGVPSTPGNIPAGSPVGTARLRFVEMGEEERQGLLYVFDLRNTAGANDSSFLSEAQSVYMAGTPAFTGHVASELIDSINYGLVYRLPVSEVKTLLNNGVSDTSFTAKRHFSVVADSNGTVILTANTNEIFATPAPGSVGASYNPGSGWVVLDATPLASIGGVPNGSTMTIDLGPDAAGKTIIVNVEVVKQIGSHKSKSVAAATLVRSSTNFVGRRLYLNKADVFKITSITQNGVDKTNSYRLVRNANPEYYGVSYLELVEGESVPPSSVSISINFQYFIHGPGDFFSVDSYSSIDYADIPSEVINGELVSLSDVIDFRPRINDAGTGFTGTGASVATMPAPFTLIRCDIEHYLPRIDKVFVTNRGDFGVIKGVPSISPREPKTPDNAMALYLLEVPAFTKDVKDINSVFINNRRYTMRDIGRLENRISNLEYYTTLSMLETETSSMQVVDPVTGLNRFKNGFVTDNFVDHSVGHFSLPGYKCAISSEEQALRPEFNSESVDFLYSTGSSSNTVLTGSLVTLPFTERVFISQTDATGYLNVNPYAVYRWNGSMELIPNSDTWFDTVYTEPEVTYRVFNNGQLTQQWNSWGLNWTGGVSQDQTYTIFQGSKRITSSDSSIGALNHSRTGIKTTVNTTTSIDVVGDRIVSTDVIPYMRARTVRFEAKGLMPLSRVYAFFDDVNVSAYCQQDGRSTGQAMYTDADGEIKGSFHLPNNNIVRFRTGTKQFTLIDNADNVRETSLSYTDAPYTAKGTLLTRTQSIVATQEVRTTNRPWDPLAQSFFVEQQGGVFLTGVDVFFASKDQTATVYMELRNMDNGYPGQEVVPYSQVTLKPSEVNVSDDASVATRFQFRSPVYLQDGNEYCFVIMSNSNNYNVYVATMGEKSVNSNAYISKQPYIGVLFKSQNNTTWSADQMTDMKFVMHAARFQTGVNGIASFNNVAPDVIRLTNALVSTQGSNEIIVRLKNHGLFEGSLVTIAGVDAAPGFDVSELNKVHTVTRVIDHDSYAIEVASTANASGSFGGPNITSERNIAINTIQPTIQELLFENTNVDWVFGGVTGKSMDGTEVPYMQTNLREVTPNENSSFTTPMVVPNATDAADKLNGPAAVLAANMITFNENISPAIDVNRLGMICVANRINNPDPLLETDPVEGNASARYMTNIIGLKNAATSLRVFVDVNRPQGSNVILMYRVGNTQEEVDAKDWAEMDTVTSTVASDAATFNEAEYEKEGLSPFSFYQFKIVMVSESSGMIPVLKRFRGIALGT